MKILEVIPDLNCGGAENLLVGLSNELVSSKNTDVTILTLYPIKGDNFLVRKLSPKIKAVSLNKRKGVDLGIIFKVYKYIKNNKFDIAHFHLNAITYSILSAILYRKCKYVATIHSDAYREARGLNRFIRKILFKTKLSHPITISEESDKSFKELYNCDATLINNGVSEYIKTEDVDLEQFRKTENTKVFINVASIRPIKNQVALAKAFNKLASEGKDISIIFVGRMETYPEYGNLLLQEKSSTVHIIGQKSNPRDYMAAADYFILASHKEGLPITLLESMSVNCIPIVTAVGGNKNVVKDNHNGYIIEKSDEESIYNRIKEILENEDKEKNEQIKKNIAKDFKNYSIEECAHKHNELFTNLVNK